MQVTATSGCTGVVHMGVVQPQLAVGAREAQRSHMSANAPQRLQRDRREVLQEPMVDEETEIARLTDPFHSLPAAPMSVTDASL